MSVIGEMRGRKVCVYHVIALGRAQQETRHHARKERDAQDKSERSTKTSAIVIIDDGSLEARALAGAR